MKRSGRKRRSAADAGTGGVSLFPFLAVLISTMGALIILLVVLAEQAHRQAVAATRRRASELGDQLRAAADLIDWESETLRASREQTSLQLRDARLALGHLEEHSRRLRHHLAELQLAWEQLQKTRETDVGRQAELADRLRQTEAEIAQLQARLAEQERRAAQQANRYAIVPYAGPHGTGRRPIYLECRKDAVVLQPEGIEFVPADFAGPPGPGNPLEVALRAVREHYAQADSGNAGESAEPYPLLVVRPDGIAAYYAARAALASWEGEIGYELVNADWQLDFPPPSLALQRELALAVSEARRRYQRLAAVLAAERRAERPRYVVSPAGGGLVPESPYGARFEEPVEYQRAEPQPALAAEVAGAVATENPALHAAGQREPGALGPSPGPLLERPSAGVPDAEPNCPGDSFGRQPHWPSLPSGSSNIGRARGTASLAQVRGKNWALPNATANLIPVRRPIRIDCAADRLVLVPEPGLARGADVRLSGPTLGAIDQVVSSIWSYMEQWGSAGNGLYWRPVLDVHVAPGAEHRFADLERLLQGSGLIVERHGQ